MKKKIIVMGLCVAMAVSMLGCSSGKDKKVATSSKIETADDGSYMASKTASKVELCEYKGVKVGNSTENVEQTDIDSAINKILSSHATTEKVTEGNVADGDVVNIDYVGTLDGSEFEGGSAQGYDLTIGSGSFIEGFETGLVGAAVGSTVTLDLTFPESYTSTTKVNDEEVSLAGKAVQFKVTVNYISVTNTPELTDEFVADNSADCGDATTVDGLNTYVKDQLVLSNKLQDIWPNVLADCEVDLDSAEVQEKYAALYKYYENVVKSNYGTDLESYVKEYGSTMDDFEKSLNEEAEYQIKCKTISNTIARKEGITLPKEEYDDEVKTSMSAYGYTDVEKYEKDYPKQDTIDNLIYYKVLEFIGENAEVVDDSETEAATENTSEDTTEAATEAATETTAAK